MTSTAGLQLLELRVYAIDVSHRALCAGEGF